MEVDEIFKEFEAELRWIGLEIFMWHCEIGKGDHLSEPEDTKITTLQLNSPDFGWELQVWQARMSGERMD